MSLPLTNTPPAPSTPASLNSSRPLGRIVLHWVRRLHLYLGLFLFPWAILYGFTGFLFNHPAIWNSQRIESFDSSVWSGTPMETPPDRHDTVRQVVEALQLRLPNGDEKITWIESEPVRYAGDFAFGKAESDRGEINLLFDVAGNGGTVRHPARPPVAKTPSPGWTISPPAAPAPGAFEPLQVTDSLAQRLQKSLESFTKNHPMECRNPTLTSVPDLLFIVESKGQRWRAAFNSMKGTLTALPVEATEPLPWRNFLLRLHTTHVYPFSRGSAKWLWVLGADAMGIILIYWGVSGLLMWWQIKSTRSWGWIVLAMSTVCAILLSISMHSVIQA